MESDADPLTHNVRSPQTLHDIHTVISACQHGRTIIVEEALKNGISQNSTDQDGCSLLHWAAINNRIEVVKLLLSYNADPNILGGVLESSPIHWAARNGLVAVCAILVKAGGVCNIRDAQGYTPIHLAIQGSHVALVAYFLLKFDYAKDVTDNSGMTPAMWCAYRSFSMFPLKLIVKSGADLTLKEHLMGSTALHIAAQERNLSAVMELIEGGADVGIRNKQQESPLDVARSVKNPKILDAIENAARNQGVIRSSNLRKYFTPPLSTYFYFVLPSLILISVWVLFTHLPLIIAIMTTIIGAIFILLTIKFDFNDPTYRLLPYGVTIAEASLMVISWICYAHWYVPWWAQLLFVISAVGICFSLIRIGTMDPGVVRPPKNCHSMYVQEAESGIQYQDKYCFTCFVRKMENTKHCAVCNHCVAKFDHHCPWLNSCITRKNMREFIFFVISVVFSSSIYCLATGHYSLIEIQERGFDQFVREKSFLLVTLILSFLHAFALVGLCGVQVNQISLEISTNQKIKAHRAYRSGRSSTDHNIIHQNVSISKRCHNLLEFCSSSGE